MVRAENATAATTAAIKAARKRATKKLAELIAVDVAEGRRKWQQYLRYQRRRALIAQLDAHGRFLDQRTNEAQHYFERVAATIVQKLDDKLDARPEAWREWPVLVPPFGMKRHPSR
ncbi:MAG: hypothetical protein C5B60_09105 [Chloroflexi bacterium]|nr:MAG: hypothetical protein C5B60_09105 [Chloroflexota bacterium]